MTAQRKPHLELPAKVAGLPLIVDESARRGLVLLSAETTDAVLAVLSRPGQVHVHHINVRGAQQTGDESGRFEVIYDVVVEDAWPIASQYWRELSDALESKLDTLSEQAQHELVENVAIHVSEYDTD